MAALYSGPMRLEKPEGELRRGWTTGACATAAVKAAFAALRTGRFPDPVSITLPKGETPAFALALEETGEGWARAGIIKDAGDDPDVTHGCMVVATVREGGVGIRFRAGPGVGMVTRAGLPVAPGEPAINPVPRAMMADVIAELGGKDVEIEISIPGGEALPFIKSGLGTFNSYLSTFASDRGITLDRVLDQMRGVIDFSEGKLDLLAAFLDISTNYMEHTGIQSVSRSLIQRAVGEI